MQVSMPSASTSTFMMRKRIEIVLVPFDEAAVFHRGGTDGDDGVEMIFRQDEAADMLGQMAGKSGQRSGEMHGAGDGFVAGIAPALAHLIVFQAVAMMAPYGVGQFAGDIFGEAENLAHFADGAAGAIADDGGGQGGAPAAYSVDRYAG